MKVNDMTSTTDTDRPGGLDSRIVDADVADITYIADHDDGDAYSARIRQMHDRGYMSYLPQHVTIREGYICVPVLGWMRVPGLSAATFRPPHGRGIRRVWVGRDDGGKWAVEIDGVRV